MIVSSSMSGTCQDAEESLPLACLAIETVALLATLPISEPESLLDVDLPRPAAPAGRDPARRREGRLGQPVDAKRRPRAPEVETEPRVSGGTRPASVEAAGRPAPRCSSPGKRKVFYAGAITRPAATRSFSWSRAHRWPQAQDVSFAQSAPCPSPRSPVELLFDRMGREARPARGAKAPCS